MSSVSASGDFAPPTFASLGSGSRAAAASADDSFTMVGLPVLARRAQQGQIQAHTAREADRRQAKLEEALRAKQQKLNEQQTHEFERLKREARRAMHSELAYMDQQIDSLTAGSGPSRRGGVTTQVDAAKWLLDHAYTKYPPPAFSKRRAEEEVLRARELRFRDATVSALKLLQARYAPDKSSGAAASPEWAVIGEEIVKHAYSLSMGISRGSQQEMPPLAASGIFATRAALDADVDFSLRTNIEDAD